MTERQSKLLKALIEYHVGTAEPVASSLLSKKVKVSPATVRNEMVTLEEEGYITQPHTSAGRIPTTKGYRFYLQHFLAPKKPSNKQQVELEKALRDQQEIKTLAKTLSEQVDSVVLVALGNNNFFYTGLSNLIAQPEFSNHQQVIDLTVVLDTLDEIMRDFFDTTQDTIDILLGPENPISSRSGLLITKSRVARNQFGLVAILGPTRMDYNRNTGLLNCAKMTLTKYYS